MSFKPEILTHEQVAEQLQVLQQKKKELLITRDQLAQRLKSIQGVMQENEALAAKNKSLLKESVDLLVEEWKQKLEFYPEIRAQILIKAAEFLAPPPDKKSSAPTDAKK